MENTLNTIGTRYLSANQAAARASLSRDDFDQLCDAGRGPKIGVRGDAGEHLYLESVIGAWSPVAITEAA